MELVAGAMVSLVLIIFILFLLLVIIRYRKQILQWAGEQPERQCKEKEMDLFFDMRDSGMSEDDAVEKVRYKRVHRREISERIARDNDEPKAETPK